MRSGLEIVERRNHSLPVSYLPKGQDATFCRGVY
ncbi:VanW family protein [Paenibacillus rhizoplanae]